VPGEQSSDALIIAQNAAPVNRPQRFTAQIAVNGSLTSSKKSNAFGGETPQQMVLTSLFMSAISTLAALFSALALYITYLPSGDAKWSVYLAGAFCLCIAGWQASSFFITLRFRRKLKHNRATPAKLSDAKSPPH
jgi:uncharacterized BrkB/YihY/UPF0761 family membrane protein